MSDARKPLSPEQARLAELERALRRLAAGRDAREVIEALSRRLTNKLLHAPSRAICGNTDSPARRYQPTIASQASSAVSA